ncbi:MAG: ornithine cyclodeaminase family protein [Gemmatimonadetes bacterium]|nr:ornithine cyclodeaminase family protein [Gemmatimonadota bacterium]MBK7783137.1 ornithine cyclodeaminase family protein [Gemmatimonadota bacterium]
MELLLLTRDEVQSLLDVDALLEGLEDGFLALSDGRVRSPPRSEVGVPGAGHLLLKPAWLPGHPIAVKLVSTFIGNSSRGLPTIQALITLVDPSTGTPQAVMDGSYITAMRTAACAAISARCLARRDARVLAIIGAGVQGRAHLRVLPRVRAFAEIRIASRRFSDAQALAAADPRAHACESFQQAVHGADVVCLCTSSGTPVISIDWLSPGAHVTSVGYAPPGGELPIEIARQGRLVVESRLAFEPPPAGCGELTGLDPAMGTELGDLLSGKAAARASDTELTAFKSMGHAMEDLVAADLVYRKALQGGVGRRARL